MSFFNFLISQIKWPVIGISIEAGLFLLFTYLFSLPLYPGLMLIWYVFLALAFILISKPDVWKLLLGMADQALIQGLYFSNILKLPWLPAFMPGFFKEGPPDFARLYLDVALQLEFGLVALLLTSVTILLAWLTTKDPQQTNK